MNITIANLRYSDPTNTLIDMDVSGVVDDATIPFTYMPGDTAPVSVAVKKILDGAQFEIKPYVP